MYNILTYIVRCIKTLEMKGGGGEKNLSVELICFLGKTCNNHMQIWDLFQGPYKKSSQPLQKNTNLHVVQRIVWPLMNYSLTLIKRESVYWFGSCAVFDYLKLLLIVFFLNGSTLFYLSFNATQCIVADLSRF